MNRRGFTLIELVLGLSILVIMMPSTMALFQQIIHTKAIAETRIVSTNLAEMVLEHETIKRPSQIVDAGPTSFSSGTAQTNPYYDTDFAAYTYRIEADCIWDEDSNGLDPDLDNWTVVSDCSGDSADYKKVTVRVNHEFSGDVSLTTLVTNTLEAGFCGGRTRMPSEASCVAGESTCSYPSADTLCVPSGCDCPNANDNGT